MVMGWFKEKNLRRKIKSNKELLKIFKYHNIRDIHEITLLIRDTYEELISDFIEVSKIEDFKRDSGEGTHFWFIKFVADITLFKKFNSTQIDENFSFDTCYDSIFTRFKFQKLNQFFPKEFFIFKIINSKKYYGPNSPNSTYFNILNILSSQYGFVEDILDYTLRIRQFTALKENSKLFSILRYDKFMYLESAHYEFQTNLKQINFFINHYETRLRMHKENININQIGQLLVKLKLNDSSFEKYFFTTQYCNRDENVYLPNSKVFVYDEGEFRFISYYKNKPISVTEILVVSSDEIFIRQIQGIKGANINPELDLEILQYRLVEIWAKNNGFKVLTLYGSNCPYRRLFKSGTSQEVKDRAEERYDLLAQRLKLQLDSNKCWIKRI